MEKYYILTFMNTHSAISTESILKGIKLKNAVMPTPTFITKSCGLSIKIDYENIQIVEDMINQGKINVKGIYLKEGTGYTTFKE